MVHPDRRLDTFQTKDELRAELERVKGERDAAVQTLLAVAAAVNDYFNDDGDAATTVEAIAAELGPPWKTNPRKGRR